MTQTAATSSAGAAATIRSPNWNAADYPPIASPLPEVVSDAENASSRVVPCKQDVNARFDWETPYLASIMGLVFCALGAGWVSALMKADLVGLSLGLVVVVLHINRAHNMPATRQAQPFSGGYCLGGRVLSDALYR